MSTNVKVALALIASLLSANVALATTIPITVTLDFAGASYATVDETFVLPSGFTNAVLNTTAFGADDRAVLLLNNTIVSSEGIFGPGIGSFFFTSGGTNDPFTFLYGNNSTTFDPITSPFVTGLNILHFIVNNTNQGIQGTELGGGPSSLNFEGSVTFASAVPEPSTWAMVILGFAGIGFATYRRGRRPGAF
jgi:hypothetical protein